MVSLVLGGARSGKSRFAQSLGSKCERPTYIATARAQDDEMSARIARHRRERGENWTTIEEPLHIADAVERNCRDCDFLLIDCLTLWLSNYCWEHRERAQTEIEEGALREVEHVAGASTRGRIVLVTNEVGCGLVPESAVGRMFRDLQGRVNQKAAELADEVFQLVAGIPVVVKQPGGPR